MCFSCCSLLLNMNSERLAHCPGKMFYWNKSETTVFARSHQSCDPDTEASLWCSFVFRSQTWMHSCSISDPAAQLSCSSFFFVFCNRYWWKRLKTSKYGSFGLLDFFFIFFLHQYIFLSENNVWLWQSGKNSALFPLIGCRVRAVPAAAWTLTGRPPPLLGSLLSSSARPIPTCSPDQSTEMRDESSN